MTRIVLALCLSVGATLAAPSAAQVISVTEEPEVIGIDGVDLHRARHVLRRFFANERHPECYRVLFSTVDGNLSVEFVPRLPPVIVVREGDPVDPNRERRCGRNVGYILDRQGNVLRRIYPS